MEQNERAKGMMYALFAFVSWGVFPIFFKLYSPDVSSYEILIHRIIWSVVFMAIFFAFSGGFGYIFSLLREKRTRNLLLISGFLISLNWWIYVYAVASGQILAATLGYFINPLMSMLLGAIVLKERLNIAGKFAIFIVTIAIGVQIYFLGSLPLISIFLPISFALYALVRKRANIGAMAGLFVETLLLLPFALGYFAWLEFGDQSNFGFRFDGLIMVLSGVITILPLVAFNAAATRISLTLLGFMQYISPTLASLVGVLIYDEELGLARAVSFGLIWLAIFIVSIESIKNFKRKSNE